ncbi:MFS transporter [Aulographum hederae CBS 113979]|uniref:MFS transporter n=1 Tax=Aulographum hederae CBS 113979 TaxID=1176131 RepID=A0A6G1GMZ6_9PEZI|nr:MFS transporter [Aulographum hederae CBS 113979]
MQSFLTYRRLGQTVRKQIEQDAEKAIALTVKAQSHTQQPPPPQSRPDLVHERHQSDETLREKEEEPSPALDSPTEDVELEQVHEQIEADTEAEAERVQTRYSERTALGHALTGISPRSRTTAEGRATTQDSKVFVVGWSGDSDPFNPQNFSRMKKARIILCVASIAFIVTFASSIDSAVLPQAAEDFGVSEVTESLATALFLVGFGVGSLYAGPLSELYGRNYVYMGTLLLFMIWIMAAALAPNIGAQVTFRFLAGVCGSPALTLAGGTVADVYNPLERTYGFPLFAISGFGGPVLGPVVGSYMGPSSLVSWRWTEWITLIIAGLVLTLVVLFQPETYAPLLLSWKAQHLRKVTGDDRFKAELEIMNDSLAKKLIRNLSRPFLLVRTELIILLMTLYLTVVYIVLFTFFDGYTYIFSEVYGTSQGLTNVLFVAMFVGILSALVLVPFIYSRTKKQFQKNLEAGKPGIPPEERLWFVMLGCAPAMPISLFWMAWTDYSSISIWSPLLASVLFGYGVIGIFISAYMYIIDSYQIYAASALTFLAFVRYLVAGGMTVVGIPFYRNVGTHWTLTIMACIGLLLMPVPYALYIWGPKVRKFSKFAVNKS